MFVVCRPISKIMRDSISWGASFKSIGIADTVIFIVPKTILIDL